MIAAVNQVVIICKNSELHKDTLKNRLKAESETEPSAPSKVYYGSLMGLLHEKFNKMQNQAGTILHPLQVMSLTSAPTESSILDSDTPVPTGAWDQLADAACELAELCRNKSTTERNGILKGPHGEWFAKLAISNSTKLARQAVYSSRLPPSIDLELFASLFTEKMMLSVAGLRGHLHEGKLEPKVFKNFFWRSFKNAQIDAIRHQKHIEKTFVPALEIAESEELAEDVFNQFPDPKAIHPIDQLQANETKEILKEAMKNAVSEAIQKKSPLAFIFLKNPDWWANWEEFADWIILDRNAPEPCSRRWFSQLRTYRSTHRIQFFRFKQVFQRHALELLRKQGLEGIIKNNLKKRI